MYDCAALCAPVVICFDRVRACSADQVILPSIILPALRDLDDPLVQLLLRIGLQEVLVRRVDAKSFLLAH